MSGGLELIENGSQSVESEVRRVIRCRRQAADRVQQLLFPERPCLPRCFPANKLGKRRSASHGRNAAPGLEADFLDPASEQFHGELERIAAGRILDLYGCIRIGDDARIAWMLEVVENFAGVHPVRLEHFRNTRRLFESCERRLFLDEKAT